MIVQHESSRILLYSLLTVLLCQVCVWTKVEFEEEASSRILSILAPLSREVGEGLGVRESQHYQTSNKNLGGFLFLFHTTNG
jgi:hypothetical protein